MAICQKLGIMALKIDFYQKMSITTNVLLSWYSSMKKKIRKIPMIFDIENWLWKWNFGTMIHIFEKLFFKLKGNGSFNSENTVRPWDVGFSKKGKTREAQNLFNLSFLIRNRQARSWKRLCSLRFSLHKFVHLKCSWPYLEMCIVKVRAAWSRVSQGLTVYHLESEWMTLLWCEVM